MAAVTVRRLFEDEWSVLAALRLAALREAPSAFGSTLERELAFDEATWRSRCTSSCYLLAEVRGEPAGMAAVTVLAGEPPGVVTFGEAPPPGAEFHLVSMWVDPRHRGQGVAGSLIEKAAGAARQAGATSLQLCVVEENEPAVRAYEKAGFAHSGRRACLPHSPSVSEEMMCLRLV